MTKASRWSYEEEWRIAGFETEQIRRFPPESLVEVIYGCDIGQRDRAEILAQLMMRPTMVRLYQAHRSSLAYQVELEYLGEFGNQAEPV